MRNIIGQLVEAVVLHLGLPESANRLTLKYKTDLAVEERNQHENSHAIRHYTEASLGEKSIIENQDGNFDDW